MDPFRLASLFSIALLSFVMGAIYGLPAQQEEAMLVGIKRETDSPAYPFFIETLRKTPALGSGFKIGKLLDAKNSAKKSYSKYDISYESDGLFITGVMNVPRVSPPPGGFPVLILNHGFIRPEIYYSGRGTERAQDFFSSSGYVTIHSDYRGHASSSPAANEHHDFYAGFTRDILNLVGALKKSGLPWLDASRIGIWGHSMGGGISARIAVLMPEVRAFVLFAPISAQAEDNFYELPDAEQAWLKKTYGQGEEAKEIYSKVSPLTYFADITSPVQLHHGTKDDKVSVQFSQKMYQALKAQGKNVEFYTYAGEGHEFGAKVWPVAIGRALQFLDRYIKR